MFVYVHAKDANISCQRQTDAP